MNIPKTTAEDTSFMTTNAIGEKVHIPVPAGTNLGLSVGDLHYNRKLTIFHPIGVINNG